MKIKEPPHYHFNDLESGVSPVYQHDSGAGLHHRMVIIVIKGDIAGDVAD